MERYLNKKYKLVESHDYDDILKINKVKFFFRKLEEIVRQTIRLSEKDGKYLFETFWPMTMSSAMFRPGVPFDELRMDGAVVRSTIDFKDNTMIHKQVWHGIETTFLREYSDKQIVSTVTCGKIVSNRVYVRVYEK